MQDRFFVGVGRVSLFFRQSRSLKDKRSGLQSVKQKLRNEGWSVVEVGHQEDFKKALLGFSYCAASPTQLDQAFDKAAGFLLGNFEVIRKSKEVLEFDMDASLDENLLMRSQLGDID